MKKNNDDRVGFSHKFCHHDQLIMFNVEDAKDGSSSSVRRTYPKSNTISNFETTNIRTKIQE